MTDEAPRPRRVRPYLVVAVGQELNERKVFLQNRLRRLPRCLRLINPDWLDISAMFNVR